MLNAQRHVENPSCCSSALAPGQAPLKDDVALRLEGEGTGGLEGRLGPKAKDTNTHNSSQTVWRTTVGRDQAGISEDVWGGSLRLVWLPWLVSEPMVLPLRMLPPALGAPWTPAELSESILSHSLVPHGCTDGGSKSQHSSKQILV